MLVHRHMPALGLALLLSLAASLPPAGGAGGISAGPAVLARVDVYRLDASGRVLAILAPIAAYEHGRFEDAAVKINPCDPAQSSAEQQRRRIASSVLGRTRAFNLYHRGDKVGTVTIDRLQGWPVAASETAACAWTTAGVGGVGWRRPPNYSGWTSGVLFVNDQGEVRRRPTAGYRPEAAHTQSFYAISPTSHTQPAIRRPAALTADEQRHLTSLARSLLEERGLREQLMERIDKRTGPSPTLRAQLLSTRVGTVRLEAAERVGLLRGETAVIANFTACPLAAGPALKDAILTLLVVVRPPGAGQRASMLLSLPGIAFRCCTDFADVYQFGETDALVDLIGDGGGQLVLTREFGEAEGSEVFAFRQGTLVRVVPNPVR